jgi:hypothetical protein
MNEKNEKMKGIKGIKRMDGLQNQGACLKRLPFRHFEQSEKSKAQP